MLGFFLDYSSSIQIPAIDRNSVIIANGSLNEYQSSIYIDEDQEMLLGKILQSILYGEPPSGSRFFLENSIFQKTHNLVALNVLSQII